jgi:hypothetical protein
LLKIFASQAIIQLQIATPLMMGNNVKILINLLARKQPRLIAGLAMTLVPQLAIVLQVILVVTHATFRLVMMMAHGVNGG